MHETLSFIPKTVKEKKKKKNNDAVTRAPEQTPRLLRVSPAAALDVGGKGAQAFRGISSQLRLLSTAVLFTHGAIGPNPC